MTVHHELTSRLSPDRSRRCRVLRQLALFGLTLMAASATSGELARAQEKDPIARTIYVPFDDLNVLLEGQTERVFLTKEEYEELLEQARIQPEVSPPQSVAILSSAYAARIEEGVAQVDGTIEIEVLEAGFHHVPLALQGVRIRRATMDDRGAPMIRDANGVPSVLIQEVGTHQIKLELSVPVQTSAAQQSLQFQLPYAAAGQLTVDVAGNVEVKSGGHVVSRTYDEATDRTSFDLVPDRGPTSLVMSLNNRRLQQDRTVLARSVLVSELTSAYERLHGTIAFDVIHGAIDEVSFRIPPGFQVTDVETQQLAQWVIEQEQEGDDPAAERRLVVRLREARRTPFLVHVAAIRTPPELTNWSMPVLQPLDVAGSVAVLGMVTETRLDPVHIEARGLIPVANDVLQGALPPSVLRAEPGAPTIQPVAAYFAPGSDFELTAELARPDDALRVATHLLLNIGLDGMRINGGFVLTAENERRRVFDFEIPTGWMLEQATLADGQVLPVERYPGDTSQRIHIELPTSIEPGESETVYFAARRTTDDWLGTWQQQQLTLPTVRALDAKREQGAIAITSEQDLTVRATELSGLEPLDASQRASYGLNTQGDQIAYRFDRPGYTAQISVERTEPWLTSRNYSFFRLREGSLTARYELVVDVRRARTRQIELILPENTPATFDVQGLAGVEVKETRLVEADGEKRWQVQLAQPTRGTVRLIGRFEQLFDSEQADDLALPLIRVAAAAYENEMVAIEGDDDLDVAIETQMRPVDIGELAEAEYLPGRQLLGAFAATEQQRDAVVRVARRELRALPPAIVQRAELVTLISSSGRNQTAARYELRTKVSFVEVELPPEATLWAVLLDRKPVKPRRRGDAILLTLQGDNGGVVRDLQVVYEVPISSVKLVGRIQATAPRLILKDAEGAIGSEVPQADLVWKVFLPTGFDVSRVHGTVFVTDPEQRASPLAQLAQAAYTVGGQEQAWGARALKQSVRVAGLSDNSVVEQESSAARDFAYQELRKSNQMLDDMMDASPSAPMTATPLSDSDLQMPTGGVAGGGGFAGGDDSPSQADGGVVAGAFAGGPPETGEPGGSSGSGSGREPSAEPELNLSELAVPPPPSRRGGAGQGPAEESAPQDPAAPARDQVNKAWALQGLSSLSIEIDQEDEAYLVEFTSVGDNPVLAATIVHRNRLNSFNWAIAIAILVGGLAIDRLPAGIKIFYLIVVIVAALGLPLLGGAMIEFEPACQMALYAGLGLIPLFVVTATCRSAIKLWSLKPGNVAGALVALALVGATSSLATAAQEDDRGPPVTVPEDAVIVPYDANDVDGPAEASQVLVPYQEYTRLWNLAFPGQPIGPRSSVAAAVAGASFRASLSDGDQLTVRGTLEIEVFAESGEVQVPLALQSAVITSATMDGQPARLRAILPDQPANAETPEQAIGSFVPTGQHPVMTVGVEGPGRHTLELEMQVALQRQGGWRNFDAVLPTGPATQLTLTVPNIDTHLRVYDGERQRTVISSEADQEIDLEPAPNGSFRLAWRPRIDQGDIDQSLTVDSRAVLDVREDGTRMTWHLRFSFGQSERSSFQFDIPGDYLVEKISGTNVRGWNREDQDDRAVIDVELLQAVRNSELIEVICSKRYDDGFDEVARMPVPYVNVRDSALHRGLIAIRRSPVLELEVVDTAGVSRTSADSLPADLSSMMTVTDSPLGTTTYQAFRFNTAPFTIDLERSPLVADTEAEFQTLLRLGETATSVETRFRITVGGRPVQQLDIQVPTDLQIEDVALDGSFLYSVDEGDDTGDRLLRIYLAQPREGSFDVTLRGDLAEHRPDSAVELPRLVLQDVQSQRGMVVVQVDPSLNAQPRDLVNCEPVLMARAMSWLDAGQRSTARLAIQCRTASYQGSIQLTPKSPRVTCDTFTNVRLTYRAIEETILLDFRIEEAGIRQVVFRLPVASENALVQAQMVREESRQRVDNDQRVQITLDLQDAIMGQYRVVIENDRALALGPQPVPVPRVDTGEINEQFVTIQNAGRDEIVITEATGFEALQRGQRQYQVLAERLGTAEITQAYVVREDSRMDDFRFEPNRREIIQTVGANIYLAETTMIVDEGGGYRAAQVYRVDNRTEPYLEIELPAGARLWTAHVADRPVKPAIDPGGNDSRLRIPLVKTAEGDLDYLVVLKYGGRIDSFGALSRVSFPMIKTVNVNVELSQVKLHLPESFEWFNFDGTAVQVDSEDEFQSAYVAYRTRQVERLTQALQSRNSFSVKRAMNNLKMMDVEAPTDGAESPYTFGDARVWEDLSTRRMEALRKVEELEAKTEILLDNRDRLNSYYREQSNDMSRNSVNRQTANFHAPVEDPSGQTSGGGDQAGGRFDRAWLDQNGLSNQSGQLVEDKDESGEGQGSGRGQSGAMNRYRGSAPGKELDRIQREGEAAGEVFRNAEGDNQQRENDARRSGESADEEESETAESAYERRLQQLAAQPGFDGGRDANSIVSGGQPAQSQAQTATERFSELGLLSADPAGDEFGYATGWASLDVELPSRGRLFLFSTPRGDVEISARTVKQETVQRSVHAGWLLGIMAGIGIAVTVVRRLLSKTAGQVVLSCLLVGTGILSVLSGYLPILGLVLIVSAALIVIQSRIEVLATR